jgi:hypothetical protein
MELVSRQQEPCRIDLFELLDRKIRRCRKEPRVDLECRARIRFSCQLLGDLLLLIVVGVAVRNVAHQMPWRQSGNPAKDVRQQRIL